MLAVHGDVVSSCGSADRGNGSEGCGIDVTADSQHKKFELTCHVDVVTPTHSTWVVDSCAIRGRGRSRRSVMFDSC